MTTTPSRLWALAPLTATCAALLLIPLRDPLAWWHLFWGRTIAGLNAIPAAAIASLTRNKRSLAAMATLTVSGAT